MGTTKRGVQSSTGSYVLLYRSLSYPSGQTYKTDIIRQTQPRPFSRFVQSVSCFLTSSQWTTLRGVDLERRFRVTEMRGKEDEEVVVSLSPFMEPETPVFSGRGPVTQRTSVHWNSFSENRNWETKEDPITFIPFLWKRC